MVHPAQKKGQFWKFCPMHVRGVCMIPRIGASHFSVDFIRERRTVYSCKSSRKDAISGLILKAKRKTRRIWRVFFRN